MCWKKSFFIFEVISKDKDEEEFQNIIHDLLSPAERIMIAKRLPSFIC